MKISIQNQEFRLHHSGAAFWEAEQMLLISDVHLGKVAHFRKHGFAIPLAAVTENFKRLDEVVSLFKPRKIVFLGDLFHSEMNKEWDFFCDWVRRIGTPIVLVEGNHDILSGSHYCDLDIAVLPQWESGPFLLTHHPQEGEGVFNICGHVHPGIKIKDLGKQPILLPCFFQKPNQMVLPAFGAFTGKYFLKPDPQDKVYAIAQGEVLQVH